MLRKIDKTFLTVLAYAAIDIAVIISLIFAYHVTFSRNSKNSTVIESRDDSSVIINGDTTKRVYFLNDTSTGMVWIGIPGVNQTK